MCEQNENNGLDDTILNVEFGTINEELVSKVNTQRVAEICTSLTTTFETVQKTYNEMQNAWLCPIKLYKAVYRATLYEERYVWFHFPTKEVDSVKRAAFIAKWLLHFTPICISNPHPETEKEVETLLTHYIDSSKQLSLFDHLANEIFALYAACNIANIPDSVFDTELRKLVFYTFKYRPIDDGMLILWLETLRRIKPAD